jgi:hypothetical protein
MSQGFALTLLLGLVPGFEPTPEQLFTLHTRTFAMPIAVEAERAKDIQELVLEMSRDQGRSWEVVARKSPDAKEIVSTVPADGLYWFRLRIVMRNGEKSLSPEIHVRVQTEGEPPLPNPAPLPSKPEDEVAKLKERIRELEKRVEQLEKNRKE